MKPITRAILLLLLAVAASAGAVAQQASSVSIDTLMATPFPTDLVAAPAAGRIAWVSSQSGVHNVLVADPAPGSAATRGMPDHKWRAVTSYTGDNGLWITELAWTSDAKTLVYVRGDGANRQGESPNPAQLQDGTDQAVFAVAVDGGAPRRLGAGSGPAVSPQGQGVAWVARGQIWGVDLSSSADKPAQLVNSRGSASGLVWSPDGSRIAWIRQGAAPRARMFSPRREVDEPWSVRVADVKTGSGRQAWKADAGYGSAFQGVVADSQLNWGAGDRLVFPWEKDGWLHLYSVPATGGAATMLTPGAFEVEYVGLSPDRARVVYNSNQDDIDKRHVWTVPVDGSAKPVRNGVRSIGSEWQPVMMSDGNMAAVHADAQMPPHVMVIFPDGNAHSLLENMLPAGFDPAALVTPQPVVVTATDGMPIHA